MANPAMNGIGDRDNRRSLAWRVFFEASTRLQGILESRMKAESGISLSDYNILLTLYEAPNRQMRMGELSEHLGYSPSRLTYLVNQLSRQGWVERVPSDDDRRGYVARLTDPGAETTDLASHIHQEAVRELLLDDMTDAHIDMIVEAFGFSDGLDSEQTE
ncbi:MAG: MarR family transcriptional regulator [Scrofimicrobium sp.]